MNHEELKKQIFKENPKLEKEYNKFDLAWWLGCKKVHFIIWWNMKVLRKKIYYDEL